MLKRLSIFAALASLAFSFAGYAQAWPNTFGKSRGREEVTLSATLSHLNLKEPAQDAKEHVASGDLRPVGLIGYSCSVPDARGASLPPKVAIRCLEGTSDFIESDEHRHLIEVARTYAIAYNEALDQLVNAGR